MVSEWIENIWLLRKNSISIRSRNIRSRLKKYVHHSHLHYVFEDFLKVIDIMTKHGLIKRNISRYDYYIIRLSSHINALLIKKRKDLVHNKTRKILNDRLFCRVYLLLGWDKNCECRYYLKWKITLKNDFLCIMVYRKWCTTSYMTRHPNVQKLDELYELVVQGMKVLERFYILQNLGLSDDYKYLIYDFLNDNYEEYTNAFNKMENNKWGHSSD